MLEESWSILTAGGELVQGLNDFLDVFGDVRMTGKIGTDIVEGKLTWVIGHALQACTPQQRQIIKARTRFLLYKGSNGAQWCLMPCFRLAGKLR